MKIGVKYFNRWACLSIDIKRGTKFQLDHMSQTILKSRKQLIDK